MRAGISTVIIPKLNEKDLVDVPEEAKQKLKFIPVENVDEVLNAALEKNGTAPASESKAGVSSQDLAAPSPRVTSIPSIQSVYCPLRLPSYSNNTATLFSRDNRGGVV